MTTLTGVCLLSSQVQRMRAFYRDTLHIQPRDEGEEICSFATPGGAQLSILDIQAMDALAPGTLKQADKSAFSLEFEVADPDAEYANLLALGAEIVRPPTTYPWGRRAVWFHDPDGNIVSFYQPVKS